MAKKFEQYTINIDIIVKNALIKTYFSISVVEYFHNILQQIYFIVTIKIPGIKPNLALHIFFKIINNLV